MADKKLLSPLVIYLLGINSIIGSGIFLLAGKIYRNVGNWSLLAILLAGFSLFTIAFSYANMSKLYPENGGAFIYARRVFGRFMCFIIGIVTWLLGTVTLATEVSALLTALKMIFPTLPTTIVGVSLLLSLGFLSYFGSSLIANLDNITAILKLLIVIVFVVTSIWLAKVTNFISQQPLTNITHHFTLKGFLVAYGTVFFFFTGFSFLPVNAEKMNNPTKNLPKMISLVMLSCISVYLILQSITIGVLGATLPNTIVPAATIFAKIVGHIGIPLFVSSICISILGVIVATTFNTPTWAVILTTVGAICLFLTGDYLFLSELTVFMSFVQYLATGCANVKKRYYLIGLSTIGFSIILLTSFSLTVLLLGVSCIVVLALIYLSVKVDDAHLAKVKATKQALKVASKHTN